MSQSQESLSSVSFYNYCVRDDRKCSLSGLLKGKSRVVAHIFVTALRHVSQLRHNLLGPGLCVEELLVCFDNAAQAECHVCDLVIGRFQEGGDDVLVDLRAVKGGHDSR